MPECVYTRAQVKSQVCEIGIGRVWIKKEINFLSYSKWDVLYHRYDRGITGNEFHVILMILLSGSIMRCRMKKLNHVKFCPSRSLPLIPALPHVHNSWPRDRLRKELTADTTSFPFIHFLSAARRACVLSPVISTETVLWNVRWACF